MTITTKKTAARTAIAWCLHDDTDYLQASLDSLTLVGTDSAAARPDAFAFLSRLPWHAAPGDWQAAAATAEALGLTVVTGDWPTEHAQRQAVRDHLPLVQSWHRDAGNRRFGTAG